MREAPRMHFRPEILAGSCFVCILWSSSVFAQSYPPGFNDELIVGSIPVEAFDEQGLLGLVLHPEFPAPPYIYLFYTPFTGNQTGNTNRVSRFTVGPTTIDPASEVVLLPNISAGLGFHLGGCLRFGADGNLYISTGDTGWSTPYPQDAMPKDVS